MSSFVKFQAEKEFDLLSQIGKKSSARWHFSLSPQQTTEVVDKLWQCWLEPLKTLLLLKSSATFSVQS